MTYESQTPARRETPTDTPGLAALLAAAQRPSAVDPEGEERALAAFRSARDGGAYAVVSPLRRRRRRRDDWRSVSGWRGMRPVRVLLGGLVATTTLGGAAMAAGAAGIPAAFGGSGPQAPERPAHSASATPVAPPPQTDGSETPQEPTATQEAGRPAGGPGRAQSEGALCEAHRNAAGRGKRTDSAAFERLETAAGGPSAVAAYCDELLGPASQGKAKGRPGADGRAGKPERPTPGKGNARADGGRGDAPDRP
jgi:hypothetical protein